MENSRRRFLQMMSSLACLSLARSSAAAQVSMAIPRRMFGVQTYTYAIRQRQERGFGDPLAMLQFASQQGFGSLQLSLGIRDADYLTQVRTARARSGITLEGIVSAPQEDTESDRFESELRICQAAEIEVVRTVLLSGRRYETFRSLDDYRQFKRRAELTLTRLARIADRFRMRVAVENHKDFRVDEFVPLLRRLDSEYVGVCLDTGNNLALLEDPWKTIDTLAPLTMTVHIKDMAFEASPDGFWMAEVPLGRGNLDLPRLVRRIHQANPRARFQLEMMTRNPLSIPCLSEQYWPTMPDVPGSDLAQTLRLVRQHARPANNLPRISQLEPAEQLRLEQEHVTQSQRWANEHLFTA